MKKIMAAESSALNTIICTLLGSEGLKGIEPSLRLWKSPVMPLDHSPKFARTLHHTSRNFYATRLEREIWEAGF